MKKMKIIVAVIFISILTLLTLSKGLPTTIATGGYHHAEGHNYPYSTTCTFSMCCHDGTVDFGPDDTWTSTGAEGIYQLNGVHLFYKGNWQNEAAAGGYGDGYYHQLYYYYPNSVMTCKLSTNNNPCYYYDTDTPQWGWFAGTTYCDYIFYNYTSTPLSPEVSTIQASTTANFYDPNNPSNVWTIITNTVSPYLTAS